MKKISLFVGAAAMLIGVSAFADVKIAVIDLQKILATSPQVADARDKMKAKYEPRKKEITAAQKTLQGDFEKLSKNKAVMKDDERKTLEAKIDDEQKKLRAMASDFEQKFNEDEEKTMQAVTKQIQTVVDKFAADQKYDLILAKGATAYNADSLDVTDKIVDSLKKQK
jgi:outer membrane protein